MRPVKIRVRGYRRLADTGCDLTPRILAFVGQNEAGKSSLLQALTWVTEARQTALAHADQSRANRVTEGWIAGVIYRLDEADQQAIDGLGLQALPDTFALWKQADGALNPTFPDKVHREPKPFTTSRRLLTSAQKAPLGWQNKEGSELPEEWATQAAELLQDPDHEWTKPEIAALTRLQKWVASPKEVDTPAEASGEVEQKSRDTRLAEALDQVLTIVKEEHPRITAAELLQARVPRFIQFEERFRALPTRTPFNPQGLLTPIEPSIANLLQIAGIEVSALEQARKDGDDGEMATITRKGNGKLRTFFSQAWNQSGVTVEFTLKESGLECLICETEHERFTNLEERSDGLRAFIALSAFVESQNLEIPPVLLIDEAETHLHIDAQADLVSALLTQLNVTQVLYTTHSPGCLPSDLGTGIRLVARDPDSPYTSSLRSDFWTNTGAGFSPLLYAMGASAAAFSVCRHAVLAEGASEMVMLPTLLRQANGVDDLGYQIVQGLAQATLGVDDLDGIAARVMYLVDGDGDGDNYRQRLLDLDVETDRIVQLPEGWALEDLLEPDYVLAKMAALRRSAPLPSHGDLDGDGPLMTKLSVWAKTQTPPVDLAGKVALAYAVIEDSDRRLRPEALECLQGLHERLLAGFARRGIRRTGNSETVAS